MDLGICLLAVAALCDDNPHEFIKNSEMVLGWGDGFGVFEADDGEEK